MKPFFIRYILLLCLLWCRIVNAACPDDVITQLFQQLASTISWVDINPDTASSSCQMTIRYYPCDTPIDMLLNKAVDNIKLHQCIWLSHGEHTHIEGYCALTNVSLLCLT